MPSDNVGGPPILRVSLCNGHALGQPSKHSAWRLQTSGTHNWITFLTPVRCQPHESDWKKHFYCCILMMNIPSPCLCTDFYLTLLALYKSFFTLHYWSKMLRQNSLRLCRTTLHYTKPTMLSWNTKINVSPFPTSSEESTNRVCFRYKADTRPYWSGISCSIGDNHTESIPPLSARFRYRVLVSVLAYFGVDNPFPWESTMHRAKIFY